MNEWLKTFQISKKWLETIKKRNSEIEILEKEILSLKDKIDKLRSTTKQSISYEVKMHIATIDSNYKLISQIKIMDDVHSLSFTLEDYELYRFKVRQPSSLSSSSDTLMFEKMTTNSLSQMSDSNSDDSEKIDTLYYLSDDKSVNDIKYIQEESFSKAKEFYFANIDKGLMNADFKEIDSIQQINREKSHFLLIVKNEDNDAALSNMGYEKIDLFSEEIAESSMILAYEATKKIMGL